MHTRVYTLTVFQPEETSTIAVRGRAGDAALGGAAVLEHLPQTIGAAEHVAARAVVVDK
jgi:hypothetical protein